MKNSFRRLLAFVIAFMLICALLPSAFAEQETWDCPVCGRNGNKGNYCGNCGEPRPQAKVAPAETIDDTIYTSGDFEYQILTDGTARITKYNGKASALDIPGSIDTYRVTSIGDHAFSWCNSLTSITIPDSVTCIGEYAFSWCAFLISIMIPESVSSIGDSAFHGCSRLTSITIPDSVTSIGDYAFRWCSSLTSITIPDGVTKIGDYAFSWCRSLTSIKIPDGVTKIESGAFYGCTGLTSIKIPHRVTKIGDYAFSYCAKLTSIEIPDSVTEIGDDAFSGCNCLVEIKLHFSSPLKAHSLINDSGIIREQITLFTPIGTGPAYRDDAFFKDFKEIKPILS